MAQSVQFDTMAPRIEEDRADASNRGKRDAYDPALASDADVVVYRISGAFFFGAAAAVGAALDRIAERPKAYIVDFSGVSVLDSTAAATLEGFVRKARRSATDVYITGASRTVSRTLLTYGVRPPGVRFRSTIPAALAAARGLRGPARKGKAHESSAPAYE
jgi:SulP family sulfate permease